MFSVNYFLVLFTVYIVFVCASTPPSSTENDLTSTTSVDKTKPPFYKKAETARWLAHENVWGTLATTSLHLNGRAWAATKSFVDGSISNSTGNIYIYDSDLDYSIQVRRLVFNFHIIYS